MLLCSQEWQNSLQKHAGVKIKWKNKYIHIYNFHVNGEILKRFAFSGLAFIELINEVIITFEMFSTLHNNDAWMMMLMMMMMVATITFWLSSIGFSLTQYVVVYHKKTQSSSKSAFTENKSWICWRKTFPGPPSLPCHEGPHCQGGQRGRVHS